VYDFNQKYWDPKIELMSPSELRILQERRLRQAVQYAYHRSLYYKKTFDEVGIRPEDIRTLEDINKIPLLDKYKIRDSTQRSVEAGKRSFHEFITVPEETFVTVHTTSGTTGVPLTQPLTETELTFRGIMASGEHMARGLWGFGLRPGDILAHLWNLGGAMVGGGNHVIPRGGCAPELFLTVIPCHVGRTERIIEIIKDIKATAMCSTPSYALYLPEVAKKMGLDVRKDLNLRFIITSGEPGSASVPGLRERLEDLYKAKAYDMYGAPGVGLMCECGARSGFHIVADGFYIQIIHPETKEELPPGKVGSIVGTALGMTSFPFIRFDTEDRGALITEPCPCGRTHPRISSVPGRWDDVVKIKGFRLYPDSIEKVVKETEGCTGEFVIFLEKDENDREQVRIQVEHEEGLQNLIEFQKKVEHAITMLITLKAKVEVVPKGMVARYVMKAQRIVDLRSKESKEKFLEATKVKSAKYFD
jgi:phenylacetate-CoA ligase